MNPPKPEIEGVGIVLVGSFNPRIFQPAWFATENLIREEEEQAAKIELIHRQVAIFYEVKDAATVRGCDEVIDILDREWKSSLDRSAEIVSLLVESK